MMCRPSVQIQERIRLRRDEHLKVVVRRLLHKFEQVIGAVCTAMLAVSQTRLSVIRVAADKLPSRSRDRWVA